MQWGTQWLLLLGGTDLNQAEKGQRYLRMVLAGTVHHDDEVPVSPVEGTEAFHGTAWHRLTGNGGGLWTTKTQVIKWTGSLCSRMGRETHKESKESTDVDVLTLSDLYLL